MTTTTNIDEKFNPLNNLIITTEIKKEDRSVETYFQQIKSNFYIGVKADFIIARDLFDASVNLLKEDFERLTSRLKFSTSTVNKYMNIGRDDRLNRLFVTGKLPLAWTTLYYMTSLNDEQFAKVEKVCHHDITKKEIIDVAEVSKEKQKAIQNLMFQFLKFNVDISKVDVSRYDAMVEDITEYLRNFPEIVIDTEFTNDKINSVKEKVERYIKKETSINAKESKSDEVTDKDSAVKAVSDLVNEDLAA